MELVGGAFVGLVKAARHEYSLLIRKIHDEVREVSPGVFLGPAMWKSGQERTLVLWFALDTRDQAQPIGWT